MAGPYSIKINKSEGSLEILGEDKEWVDSKLTELRDVFKNFQPVPPVESEVIKTVSQSESVQKDKFLKQKTKSRKRTNTSSRPQKNEELKKLLTSEIKGKLKKYVDERKEAFDKSQPAQAAVLATFLQDELNWSGVDHHDLYTVYTEMGFQHPANINSQLVNAMHRNRYFGNIEEGKFKLSLNGETYARQVSLEKQNET